VSSQGRAGGILAAAAIAGSATMTVELGAVRLMAPWFGASAGVWTNVIGVILLALALGYLLGARLAVGPRPLLQLGWVLVAAAAFTAWLPYLAKPVCAWFLPEGLALHQAAGLWLWGSLAASLLLFLPPAMVLGCVGPLAVEAVQRARSSHAGTAGGQVLCVSTLGSLAGTFATTHVLVPGLGIAMTLALAAGMLGATAAVLLVVARGAAVGLGAGLLCAALGAFLGRGGERPTLAAGLEVVDAAQTPYQSLRVVEDSRWETPFRMLQVNEGLDSFQSVWQPQTGLLGPGFYYDYFALPAWWDRRGGERWRVLVLGLGAGTTFRVLRGATPPERTLDLWGVEIDSEVVRLGREWFDLEDEGPSVHVIAGADARTTLRDLPRDFDLVCIDAYANQVEIPAHLCTREFFGEVLEHLVPGGWMAVNVGGFGPHDPVVEAVGTTMASALGPAPDGSARVIGARVAASRNWIVFGRRDAPCPLPGSPEWSVEGAVGDALLPGLGLPGAVHPFRGGPATDADRVLTDDRSSMELLQLRSLEEGRAHLVRP